MAGLALSMLSALAATPPGATAMTYNVLYEGARTQDTLALIEQQTPDVLCLQEVTPSFVAAFGDRLGRIYPFRRFDARPGTWGIGIASRTPLGEVQVFEQRPHRMPAMEAVVKLDGRAVRIACLHLFPPVAQRRKGASLFESLEENAQLREQQAEALRRRYRSEARPVLLLGDLNEDRDGGAIAVLRKAGYVPACAARGSACGATYPGATSPLPAVWQVDHALARGLTFLDARVLRGGGSDHFPLLARFTVRTWQEAYVEAARALLGTPYRLGGRMRNAEDGIDCQGVLFLAAQAIRRCDWRSYSVYPTRSVAARELGAPVPGMAPVASRALDPRKLLAGDVLLLVGFQENPAEGPIGELEGRKVWVWHTGLSSGSRRWIVGDHYAGEAVEVDLADYLSAHADAYAGVVVTRMEHGPAPKRCRRCAGEHCAGAPSPRQGAKR